MTLGDPRRALPSVHALLESEALRPILERASRHHVAEAVRAAVEAARQDPAAAPRDDAGWRSAVGSALAARARRSLRPLFNATGVVLHTNLGRAPLAQAAIDTVRDAASGYTNLEYDLEQGARGSRYTHCVSLLRELTGAEDALVVNNGAAALVLALDTLSAGRDAIVSRGELVEIGGSFRIPDIMAKSGARLREVGTTNRTHLEDFRQAIGDETGVLVKVHRSNFAVSGFVAEVDLRALAELGSERGIPVLHDLGSGLLIPLDRFGLSGEPIARDSITAGATIVTMSGDKMLGGPQAGIMAGTREAIARVRSNPLTRAFRVDKLTLAALEATLALYRDPEIALAQVPALAMLTAPVAELWERAERVASRLRGGGLACEVVPSTGSVGGGAFPTAELPSAAIALAGDAVTAEARLRGGAPPVIGRVKAGQLLLDFRSIPAGDDEALAAAVLGALQ